MARQVPIQDGWQLHLLHQPQEHHKVIDPLVCNLKFFFHAPQYARKFCFCLAHYANGEQGTSIAGITRETLLSTKVYLPSLSEQRAISTILSDMDAEIFALEQKRNKTRALKQGMMQELLTGKM